MRWPRLFSAIRPKRRLEQSWDIYQVDDVVVLPHLIQTSGPTVAVAPYRSLRPADPAFRSMLARTFEDENIRFGDMPDAEARAQRAFFKAAKVKSWSELYRRCRLWIVRQDGQVFRVDRWRTAPDGRGMEPDNDPAASRTCPSLEALLDHILEELRPSPPAGDN